MRPTTTSRSRPAPRTSTWLGRWGSPATEAVVADDLAAQVAQALRNTAIGLDLPLPPSSLIGVEALFAPDVLVEVEATAVLP